MKNCMGIVVLFDNNLALAYWRPLNMGFPVNAPSAALCGFPVGQDSPSYGVCMILYREKNRCLIYDIVSF